MNVPWRIELFGGLRARQDDRVIARFASQKSGALLAYLAYFQGRSHPREELAELLWPETPPEAGRHNLRQALLSIRRQLEPSGAAAGSASWPGRDRRRSHPGRRRCEQRGYGRGNKKFFHCSTFRWVRRPSPFSTGRASFLIPLYQRVDLDQMRGANPRGTRIGRNGIVTHRFRAVGQNQHEALDSAC